MFARKPILLSATAATAVLFAASNSYGAITASLNGGFFQTAVAGVNIPAGTLCQLVNLGPNGIFDPINIADGSTDHLTSEWVSGDDTVVNVTWEVSNPDFPTLAAFDLTNGTDQAGVINRQFVFTEPSGTKFGIRWFPGLTASAYYNPGGITLAAGQPYGQFTRQNDPSVDGPLYDGPVHGLNNWIYTNDGDNINLDPLLTQSTGAGAEANSLGVASLQVLPEPGTAALALFGAASLFSLRRRRS